MLVDGSWWRSLWERWTRRRRYRHLVRIMDEWREWYEANPEEAERESRAMEEILRDRKWVHVPTQYVYCGRGKPLPYPVDDDPDDEQEGEK